MSVFCYNIYCVYKNQGSISSILCLFVSNYVLIHFNFTNACCHAEKHGDMRYYYYFNSFFLRTTIINSGSQFSKNTKTTTNRSMGMVVVFFSFYLFINILNSFRSSFGIHVYNFLVTLEL